MSYVVLKLAKSNKDVTASILMDLSAPQTLRQQEREELTLANVNDFIQQANPDKHRPDLDFDLTAYDDPPAVPIERSRQVSRPNSRPGSAGRQTPGSQTRHSSSASLPSQQETDRCLRK